MGYGLGGIVAVHPQDLGQPWLRGGSQGSRSLCTASGQCWSPVCPLGLATHGHILAQVSGPHAQGSKHDVALYIQVHNIEREANSEY